jgi:cytochrome P450
MHALGKRYGCAFTVRLPFFGPTVIISDPALVKQFFQTRTDVVRNVEPNLDLVLGPGSTFGLQDEEHRKRRKPLVPPFHGKRMRAYENLVEEETLNEIATWPDSREFAVLPSTNRITLNVILRAVLGAQGAEFEALRKVMPPLVALGSHLVFMPWLHRDLGRWSPWGRFLALRTEFDVIVRSLIDRTILREFRLVPTSSRDERMHSRGVAFAPSGGGRAVVYRRMHTAGSDGKVQLQAVTTVSLG